MKKGLLIASVTSVLACGLVVGLAAGNGTSGFSFDAKAAAYDASTVTTRRIYFINNNSGGTWYSGYPLSAQVWYGSTYSGFVNASEIYGNYYYCVDFTSSVEGFLGGDLHFELRAKTGEGDKDYAYTSTCYNIPSLDKKAFDVIYINNGAPSIGLTVDVGENTGIISSVLDHYSTCDASYANGYNGYPQLKKDFLDPNATAIATYGNTTMCEEGTVSINTKIAKLEQQYTLKGWTVSE